MRRNLRAQTPRHKRGFALNKYNRLRGRCLQKCDSCPSQPVAILTVGGSRILEAATRGLRRSLLAPETQQAESRPWESRRGKVRRTRSACSSLCVPTWSSWNESDSIAPYIQAQGKY